MVKLKNKLGTRQLPTAELLIDGARAYRVSNKEEGSRMWDVRGHYDVLTQFKILIIHI